MNILQNVMLHVMYLCIHIYIFMWSANTCISKISFRYCSSVLTHGIILSFKVILKWMFFYFFYSMYFSMLNPNLKSIFVARPYFLS